MSEVETGQQGVGDLRLSARDGAVLLHLAGEAVAIGAWSCTLPSGPLCLDARAARLLGLPAGESLKPAALLDAFTPDHRDAVGRAIAGVELSGGFILEGRLRPSADRAPIRVRLTARVVPGEEGGPARLLGIVAPLRRRQDGAVEATHLAAIVASSEDAIISKTLDGVVTSWNRSAERLFGYTAAEMLGQPITRLAPPGYEDDMPDILARIRAGGRVDHYETWRRHKDGRLIRVSLTVSPIHDAAGALVGASKVVRDITAVHRATEALRGAEARLVAAEELVQISRLDALGQMAAMLAHEVNQPLTAIISYAGAGKRLLAKHGEAAIGRASEAFERTAQQARRAGRTIHALRAFAEGAEEQRRPEQLAAIVEEAVRLVAGTLQARGVRLQLHLDPACPPVMADRVLIRQVLLNLMRNAADAMERVARREMIVSTREREDMVELAVADTGSGLAPEVAERLFQPFVTTKPGGAGGGLSICRSIVEAHGGQLWAEQNPAGGMTFRFTLQRVAE